MSITSLSLRTHHHTGFPNFAHACPKATVPTAAFIHLRRRPFPFLITMPGPLRRRPPSQRQQQQRMSRPLPLRGVHHLATAAAAVVVLSLLPTPIQAFLHATPNPSSSRKPPLPLPSSTPASSITTTTTLHSSTGSGWRGGPRPDDEPVDLSGDGGVMKRVIRPGFGYKQESPPPHAYCKIAFVMKTATGQMIADRMKEPMEFMLVRFFWFVFMGDVW